MQIECSEARDTLADDVRAGLTRPLKELPPKYFYDEHGSELFDRITSLPEYYPTRAERSILNRHAPDIVAGAGAEELVELGSGTASKTRALLYAMAGAGSLRRYVPFDVDESVVQACAVELVELYPGLRVHGVVGDFGRDLGLVPDRASAGCSPSSAARSATSTRASARRSCAGCATLMGPEDRLVVGTDLVKDRAMLEAAYNDSAGVTAEFNRNVLRVINEGLGADFEPEAFEHVAFFDEANSWIEMRLRANGAQTVRIDGANLEVRFADGEEMRTEISAKFTRDAVERSCSPPACGSTSSSPTTAACSAWPSRRATRGGSGRARGPEQQRPRGLDHELAVVGDRKLEPARVVRAVVPQVLPHEGRREVRRHDDHVPLPAQGLALLDGHAANARHRTRRHPYAEGAYEHGPLRQLAVALRGQLVKKRWSWKVASTTTSRSRLTARASSCRENESSSGLSPTIVERSAATTVNGLGADGSSCRPEIGARVAGAPRSSGSGPGRPNSQPCPNRAPSAIARRRCSSVSMPSATTAAPVRSASACTACTTLGQVGVGAAAA